MLKFPVKTQSGRQTAKMKKTIKFLLIWLLGFIAAEKVYACGICSTMILTFKIPILIAFYLVSLLYGLVIYSILGVKRLAKPMELITSILKLLGIGFLCSFITIGVAGGFISVIFGILYNSIVPTRNYRHATAQGRSNNKLIRKLQYIFLLCALVIGVAVQLRMNAYFDKHLLVMLELPAVGSSARDKLKTIQDPTEQALYRPQLRELLTKGRILGRKNALEVLAEWKDKESIAIIIKACQDGEISWKETQTALKKITGKNKENKD